MLARTRGGRGASSASRWLPVVLGLATATPCAAAAEPPPQWPPPAPAGEVAPLPPAEPEWVSPADDGEPSRPRKVRSIQSGFYLGFRESAAFPGGRVAEGAGNDLDSLVIFSMPFRLEAGFRFPFGLGVGGWGQAGWVFADCSDAYSSCTGAAWGYGVQADLRFNPRGAAMPWIGVSYGREYLFLIVDDGYDTVDSTYSGTEVGFQAGIDFRAGNHFALGPHVQYTIGTYDEVRVDDGYDSVTYDIPGDGQAEHTWLTIGLKGTATF